jgi:hypothetical protein
VKLRANLHLVRSVKDRVGETANLHLVKLVKDRVKSTFIAIRMISTHEIKINDTYQETGMYASVLRNLV